ncbi:hypothetical protein [Chitinibacter sp. S2-10]|uniref:hypothetical protein n=1 Tax=Chitinibacter sp. S2-10 TaxID=3373597 RepID=UPI00397731FD
MHKMPGQSLIPLKQRYGLPGLMLGSFTPAKKLLKLASKAISGLNDEIFEHATRPAARYLWQGEITRLDSQQTKDLYARAISLFEAATGCKPVAHAAHGWQINRAALRFHQLHDLSFASDCRGHSPFWPVAEGEYTRCVQIPVTLPMLEELLPELGVERSIEVLLNKTAEQENAIHVFNLAADFDTQYLEQLGQLFAAWQEQGYQLVSLGQLKQSLDLKSLPYHHVELQPLAGRVGKVAVQGAVYP